MKMLKLTSSDSGETLLVNPQWIVAVVHEPGMKWTSVNVCQPTFLQVAGAAWASLRVTESVAEIEERLAVK